MNILRVSRPSRLSVFLMNVLWLSLLTVAILPAFLQVADNAPFHPSEPTTWPSSTLGLDDANAETFLPKQPKQS